MPKRKRTEETQEESDSAVYTGHLPAYASSANHARVVQVQCRGICSRVTWHEMTIDYPGDQVLRKADFREFEAKCLKCGRITRDPYNWFRP